VTVRVPRLVFEIHLLAMNRRYWVKNKLFAWSGPGLDVYDRLRIQRFLARLRSGLGDGLNKLHHPGSRSSFCDYLGVVDVLPFLPFPVLSENKGFYCFYCASIRLFA